MHLRLEFNDGLIERSAAWVIQIVTNRFAKRCKPTALRQLGVSEKGHISSSCHPFLGAARSLESQIGSALEHCPGVQ